MRNKKAVRASKKIRQVFGFIDSIKVAKAILNWEDIDAIEEMSENMGIRVFFNTHTEEDYEDSFCLITSGLVTFFNPENGKECKLELEGRHLIL